MSPMSNSNETLRHKLRDISVLAELTEEPLYLLAPHIPAKLF
jgi:hypothetical protein